jgi:hypothetical protein
MLRTFKFQNDNPLRKLGGKPRNHHSSRYILNEKTLEVSNLSNMRDGEHSTGASSRCIAEKSTLVACAMWGMLLSKEEKEQKLVSALLKLTGSLTKNTQLELCTWCRFGPVRTRPNRSAFFSDDIEPRTC